MFADFGRVSRVGDRREGCYDFPINVSPTCFSMGVRFPLLQGVSGVVCISWLPGSVVLCGEL